LTLERFCTYGHIRVIAAGTGHDGADAQMSRAGIQRDIRLEVPHFLAVAHILQRTELLATVPEVFADCCLEPFGLSVLPHPVSLPEIPINLFWHAKYNKDPANIWLRQLMFELFSD
jgi:DNA-binding transcriptional LysR family regulator